MEKHILEAAQVKPSARQLAWQNMEFNSFIHFGINTFTNREWGLGDEDPAIFNPSEFNPRQWVEVCKSAGMKGLVLTCKHHDGFCLWPSRYTGYSVKSSPWRDGLGDVVREVSDACKEGGIAFGIYLSPWDRHEETYGDSDLYNKYFLNQLTELLTQYGPIFCVWFDGACGEGPNGILQVYDWEAYHAVIRKLQPQAVICICGPDVRWCGNEAGHCRESEWSVVPAHLVDMEKIQDKSQKADDGTFSRLVRSEDEDIGSREVIGQTDKLIWYPAEVNTSIRPGWFYHPEEDGAVRPMIELLDIYYPSVGGNANLLLNLPPDRRGLIHENDAARMKELGDILRRTFNDNLAANAKVSASDSLNENFSSANILNEDDGYWRPNDGTEVAEIMIKFAASAVFDLVVLKENIFEGQRIEEFVLEYKTVDEWKQFYCGTVVGHKRICRFGEIMADTIRLRINRSRWCPTLSFFGVYKSI